MRYLKPLVPVALVMLIAGAAKAEHMSVTIDHAARLNVRGVANVLVGNEKVADVTVLDSRTVYVTGHQYGSTNIVITDRDGRTLYSGDVTVEEPASTVAIYRGAVRTDLTCATNCKGAGGDSASASSSPAAAPSATPAAAAAH